MQTLSTIKALLDSHGLRPNKTLGQNFLIEPTYVNRLVESAAIAPGDLVLEIGPGTGVLTDVLLERAARVIACELDHGLARVLRDHYADQLAAGRLTLIEGDCLSSKHALNPEIIAALADRPFKLIANLPYGAASPLMIALATQFHPTPSVRARRASEGSCLGQFVTIQREVADRLRAKPGTKDFGEMGVLVQAMCEVRRIAVLPPGCFWPPPKIDSEMVAITPRDRPLTDDPARLAALCRLLFTHRRKQIGGVLAKSHPVVLDSLPAGVEPTMRAEQLTIEQLVALSKAMD